MIRWAILRREEDNLVKDLKRTTLSYEKLGKKYGVSRRAIHFFCKKQGIERPVKPRGGQSEVRKTPFKEIREGLCDLFYERTPDPHDRAKGWDKKSSVAHPKASGIGMECSTLPLCL